MRVKEAQAAAALLVFASGGLLVGCSQHDVGSADNAFHKVAQGTHNIVSRLPAEGRSVKHETTHNLANDTNRHNIGDQVTTGAHNLGQGLANSEKRLAHAATSP